MRRRSKPGLGLALAAFLAWGVAAAVQGADEAHKIGLIGDSLMVATNSDDMCGDGGEIPKCFDRKFGRHDVDWSHGGGDQSWSIARRLGYGPAQVVDAADDGERWKDALAQALRVTADPAVDSVFIGMGGNDVCRDYGHDYGGDLAEIENHIDATLSHLVASLPQGARIFWSGVPDVVGYRNAMVRRRHNYLFKSCQGLWDLESDQVTLPAAKSICKDQAGDLDGLCSSVTGRKEARDFIVERLLDYYLDRYGIDEGPCGSVLNSRNGPAARRVARQFNKDLNALLAAKAAAYDGVNGIAVTFTDALFDVEIQANYVSRLDCYHPSRAGQMRLAQELWAAFAPAPAPESRFAFWYDDFADVDPCAQDFGQAWASCWRVVAGSAFDIRVDEKGWLKLQKNGNDKESGRIVRRVGDLSAMTRAWISFNHKREKLDDGGDRVYFKVYKDGVWHEVDRFKGKGVDVGEHAGEYYDLRPFISSDLRIMFQTGNQGSMQDGDRVKFDNISLFAWDDGGALDEAKLLDAGRSGATVTDAWQPIDTAVELPLPAAVLAAMETANDEDPAGLRMRRLNADGFEVRVEEEQSLDRETAHAGEAVAFAAFAPGLIADTAGRVIGEAGLVAKRQRSRGRFHRLDLLGAYSHPVVFMTVITAKGPEPLHIRLNPINGRAVDYLMEEWDYQNGAHERETMAYLVFEAGLHELAGGGRVEAGTLAVDHRWRDVTFNAAFETAPIALSQSQTERGGSAVVVRQRAVTPAGLQLRLQEEEAGDGVHIEESVGYLAIEP
ncbi:MAG TPA: SGNH/GDSL hydrolase family protein [Kiloniellaceae bacterium]|nr:SGNH/GDSL hydrolase family protein [Kiloniellaceae bacterium]